MTKIVPPTKAYLDSLVDPLLAPGLAFAIGYVGPTFQDIYFNGNLANQFGQTVHLGKNTQFELASISKTFTATLSAILGQKFLPGWGTKTIASFNGNPETPGFQIGSQFNPIPLSTLLSYTSGLPMDNSGGNDWPEYVPVPYSPAGMLGYLNMADLKLVAPPNTAYTYSNMAFSIMAQILPLFDSRIGSLSFTQLMKDYVLKPLGMNDTGFFEGASLDTFPQGYSFSGSSTPYAVAAGWEFFDAWYGAGGVISTPQDMLTWLRFNMGLIEKDKALWKCLPELQSPATSVIDPYGDSLGLGWFLTSEAQFPPGGAVWKDGEITGTNTYIMCLPWVDSGKPSQAGVFVMTNCDSLMLGGTEVVATIADDVLLTMQGVTPPSDKSNYRRVFGRG
jgi:serine-type D-Ala-D-Ala carboxypeptidase/endopeptidase